MKLSNYKILKTTMRVNSNRIIEKFLGHPSQYSRSVSARRHRRRAESQRRDFRQNKSGFTQNIPPVYDFRVFDSCCLLFNTPC